MVSRAVFRVRIGGSITARFESLDTRPMSFGLTHDIDRSSYAAAMGIDLISRRWIPHARYHQHQGELGQLRDGRKVLTTCPVLHMMVHATDLFVNFLNLERSDLGQLPCLGRPSQTTPMPAPEVHQRHVPCQPESNAAGPDNRK